MFGDRHPGAQAWLMIALLAALPLTAGCLGTAQATAMEEQDTASDLAEAWDSQAQLVSVMGLEGSGMPGFTGEHMMDAQGDYWSRASEDDTLGDGYCELWAYRFLSPNEPGQTYLVVVDRDGEVLHQGADERESDHMALGQWEIDSDQAAEIARESNQGIDEGTSKDHYGLVLMLQRDDEHPNAVWFIAGGGGDASGGGGGFVTLDAVTGEVLQSEGGFSGN